MEADCDLREESLGRRRPGRCARGSGALLSDGRQLRLCAMQEREAVEREHSEERGGHQEEAEAAQSGTHAQ